MVIAFDFDGVLSDSAHEAFVVALDTYAEVCPGSRLAGPAAALAAADLERYRFAEDPLFANFLALMPLGNRADDFGVALRILDEGRRIADQRSYDTFFAGVDAAWRKRYHARFYVHRASLREASPAAWLALQPPYEPALDAVRRHASATTLAIATAKDGESVRLLLSHWGASSLFPDELILDKDAGVSKEAHLTLLAERCDSPLARMTFVDDKLNHLESVAHLGVRCVLAGWGYNGPREREGARARDFTVATLETVDADLFSG